MTAPAALPPLAGRRPTRRVIRSSTTGSRQGPKTPLRPRSTTSGAQVLLCRAVGLQPTDLSGDARRRDTALEPDRSGPQLGKAGFDPNEPRVPAGSPDGGQWTSDGGSDASEAEGSNGKNPPSPGGGGSEPRNATGERVWERFPNADFRNKLAIAEQTADKPNFGYGEANLHSGALGRYQMTRIALQAAGMLDRTGNWTGKYDIHSSAEFLANPEAQEMALTDYLSDNEHQLRAYGAFGYVGKQIEGRTAPFTVTPAGLVAAAHREGAPATIRYLTKVENAGFVSRHTELTPENLRVETRLRTFAGGRLE